MPFYKQKPFRIEVIEVTEGNIANVFAWVSQSNAVNAHSLTSNSFVFKYFNDEPVTVQPGVSVMKRTNDSFGVFPSHTQFEERWELLTDAEANSLPTINRQTKSLEEAWTRFSEIVF